MGLMEKHRKIDNSGICDNLVVREIILDGPTDRANGVNGKNEAKIKYICKARGTCYCQLSKDDVFYIDELHCRYYK